MIAFRATAAAGNLWMITSVTLSISCVFTETWIDVPPEGGIFFKAVLQFLWSFRQDTGWLFQEKAHFRTSRSLYTNWRTSVARVRAAETTPGRSRQWSSPADYLRYP